MALIADADKNIPVGIQICILNLQMALGLRPRPPTEAPLSGGEGAGSLACSAQHLKYGGVCFIVV
ncbi:MAG: hypothetical protein PHU34_12025 [Candidatus Methanoperedens sp.]|nr:hypothetical protein [Candidatus Methanoperedens sp.]